MGGFGVCTVTVAGDLEVLITDPLGLVGPGVVFAVETTVVVGVVSVDPVGEGPGVGCPVMGCPVHVTPSADMFIPLGQRHV